MGVDPDAARPVSRARPAHGWRGAAFRQSARDRPHVLGRGGQLFPETQHLLLLLFILLYRAGEGQVVTIGPLFLVDKRSAGGLGLTTDQFGTIYGTFGTVAFIAGSVLGGYFTSWLGLRRALLPLICAMNLPNLAYVYLSTALPTNHAADHRGDERRNVRLRFWIRGRDPAHDAGNRARQIPDGPLCLRQFPDEPGADDPGDGQRQDPDGAGLPEVLCVGADFVDPGA